MLRQAGGARQGGQEESGLLLVRYVCGVHQAHWVCSYCERRERLECVDGRGIEGIHHSS